MPQIHHAQVAAAARVSRSTVSRALQNHPSLPAATRQRIQAIAQSMGYRPNPLVSALMAARNQNHAVSASTTLAVLTAWPATVKIAPLPTDRRYLTGVKFRAEELGFQFEEFWMDEPGLSDRRMDQIMVNRGIIGVLFAPIPRDHGKIEMEWDHFSLAAFAPSPQIPLLHQASHFHFRSCCTAVRELMKIGYRRPALSIPVDLASYVIDQWIGGYYAAAIALPPRNRLAPYMARGATKESLGRWCAEHRPDVIISNDPKIWALLKAAQLDDRIAFANLDWHPDQVDLAGINQRHELVGHAAVDILVGQLNRNERGVPRHPRNVLIEGRWVPGPSAPPRS